MKTTITILLLAFFAMGVSAQWELPITFENPEEDTAWVQFANAGDDPANFVLADNPDVGGINTSDFCIEFTVLETADPWVGAWSDYYDSVEITEENHMMQMMLYKDVLSPCALKLEHGRGGGGIGPEHQEQIRRRNCLSDNPARLLRYVNFGLIGMKRKPQIRNGIRKLPGDITIFLRMGDQCYGDLHKTSVVRRIDAGLLQT